MEDNSGNYNHGKRKNNYSMKSKDHSRKANFGHGSHIDQDTFDYYCQIIEIKDKNEFEDAEAEQMFANNALEQGTGQEVELACNQVVSVAFEKVLPLVDHEHQKTFEDSFLKNLRLACVDRFCSHVTQLLVQLSARAVIDGKQDIGDSFVLKCIKFNINNIEEFSSNVYACHVVRTCLDTIKELNECIPSDLAQQAYNALIASSLFVDLCQHELGSGVLQHLIRCLQTVAPKLCAKTIKNLIKKVFAPESNEDEDDDTPPTKIAKLDENDYVTNDSDSAKTNSVLPLFNCTPTARLLEVAIECSNQKYFTKLYAKIFVNRFAYLAVHEVGNFSLQKLIRCCSDLSEFEGIFSEASRCIESALQCGHGGIIAVLAETCKRLGTHQGDFINSLMKALKCFEPSEKQNEVCLRTAMMSDDKINPDRPINLHGSLTLQAMFHFRKPIKVIRSLISVPPSTLVRMFCDPRGSRIADAFFTGPFVGEKNKEKFLMHLKAHLVNIASDKHGSRAIDTAWNSVGEKAQLLIIETLSKEGAKLESSPWGRKVSKNIDLALFRANRSSWVAAVARIRQSRRLIDPLITSRSQS